MGQPSQSPVSREAASASAAPERERLGVAGAGTVACGLAACALHQGVGEVLLWARSAESAERARADVARACERLKDPGAADRLRTTQEISDLSAATIVVEAVREDESVKRALLGSLDEALPGELVIASTTSSLNISQLAAASGRPKRFFGLHVFNPVPRMRLVELCFPREATLETRARAQALCESIGKTAVEVPDAPGFVVNRILFPYLFDAVRLLERTGMEPEQVDTCMKLGAAHPMGPLELLDFVGLDVADAIGEAIYRDTGNEAHSPPGRLKQLVGEGKLGRKSGGGFYSYE